MAPWIQKDRRTHVPFCITTLTTRCSGSACFCTSSLASRSQSWPFWAPGGADSDPVRVARNDERLRLQDPPRLAVWLYFLETILNGAFIFLLAPLAGILSLVPDNFAEYQRAAKVYADLMYSNQGLASPRQNLVKAGLIAEVDTELPPPDTARHAHVPFCITTSTTRCSGSACFCTSSLAACFTFFATLGACGGFRSRSGRAE